MYRTKIRPSAAFAVIAACMIGNLPVTVAASTVEEDGTAEVQATAAAAIEPGRRISDEQAMEIAKKAVPGEVMDVDVERKLGKKTIVVEVISAEDSAELDVVIDMTTGEILAIDD